MYPAVAFVFCWLWLDVKHTVDLVRHQAGEAGRDCGLRSYTWSYAQTVKTDTMTECYQTLHKYFKLKISLQFCKLCADLVLLSFENVDPNAVRYAEGKT